MGWLLSEGRKGVRGVMCSNLAQNGGCFLVTWTRSERSTRKYKGGLHEVGKRTTKFIYAQQVT